MDFEFSEEQVMLRDQARRLLDEHCGLDVVRRTLDGDEHYAAELWKVVAEMGWMATTIPEQYGGIGFGYLELCIIAEQLGWALAPIPFSSSVYLATDLLVRHGSEQQRTEHLPLLATGERIATVASYEGAGHLTPNQLGASVTDGSLTGVKTPVADGMVADIAIVLANNSGQTGASLFLVDLNGPGVTREPLDSVDPTRPQARLIFSDAPATVLGTAAVGWDQYQAAMDRAAVLLAFEQVGGADRALQLAKEYALERYAFGRPIGSFQAIKHKLAGMYVKNVLARSNAYYGAWALSTDSDELGTAAAQARVAASEAYTHATQENIHVHGGMGATWESDCHLFYRRSRLLGLLLGSQRVWEDKLMNRLVTTAPKANGNDDEELTE